MARQESFRRAVVGAVMLSGLLLVPHHGAGFIGHPLGQEEVRILGTLPHTESPKGVPWIQVQNSTHTHVPSTPPSNSGIVRDLAVQIGGKPAAGPAIQIGYGPSAGAIPLNVSFYVSASGGTPPYLFAWEFGDGVNISNLTTGNTTHTFVLAGVYNATLWCNDSANASADLTVRIVAEAEQLTASRLSASTSPIDVGQTTSLNLTVAGGSGGYNMSWQGLPPGCPSNNSSRLGCTPTGPGIFRVFVIVLDSAGVEVLSPTFNLTVDSAPSVPRIQLSPSAVDVGQALDLSFSTSSYGSGLIAYNWTDLPPGCPARNLPAMLCAPSSAGTYAISLTVTDSNGVSVSALPSALLVSPRLALSDVHASKSTLDVGQLTDLSVRAGGGSGNVTYQWTGLPPGCPTVDSATNLCRPTGTGGFNVSVLVSDSNHESVSSNMTPLTVAPLLESTISYSPISAVVGAPMTFTVTISGGSPSYLIEYLGLPPGCSSSNTTEVSCTPESAGTYHVTSKVSDRLGASQNATTNVTVTVGAAASGRFFDATVWLTVVGVAAAGTFGLLVYWRRRTKLRSQ